MSTSRETPCICLSFPRYIIQLNIYWVPYITHTEFHIFPLIVDIHAADLKIEQNSHPPFFFQFGLRLHPPLFSVEFAYKFKAPVGSYRCDCVGSLHFTSLNLKLLSLYQSSPLTKTRLNTIRRSNKEHLVHQYDPTVKQKTLQDASCLLFLSAYGSLHTLLTNKFSYSWFQAFAVFRMSRVIFWAVLRRIVFNCLWRWNRHSVPKRRLLNTIRRRTA
jgi:hypothetical protein